MPVYNDSYSTFIAWAKIILPLLALAILSTVFLVAHKIDPTQAIPFGDIDVDELAREQRVTAPNYAGVTRDGAAISVAAKTARPKLGGDPGLLVDGLNAVIETQAGARFDLSASTGNFDSAAETAAFQGEVTLLTSSGYAITSQEILVSLAETSLQSPNQVIAEGPIGHLSAGAATIHYQNDQYLLVFKEGVKLVYDPKG